MFQFHSLLVSLIALGTTIGATVGFIAGALKPVDVVLAVVLCAAAVAGNLLAEE